VTKRCVLLLLLLESDFPFQFYENHLTTTKYRDWAWDAFVAVNSTTHVGSGYSGIKDVNVAGGDGFDNEQETFLFAEVLKYAYMIHADGKSDAFEL
jgi:Glycosyl hydrolase family 47